MTYPALSALFAPRQIAIYADFSSPDRYGWRLIETLLRHQYAGQIWPVSAQAVTMRGLTTTRHLPAEAQPDVSVIAQPIETTFNAIEESARRGARVAVIATIGFAESGPAGAVMQAQLVQHARAANIRLLGPNCLGAIHTANGATLANSAALEQAPLRVGHLSLFSHSGSLLSTCLGFGQANGIGFRYLAATGNEADLTLEDLMTFALDDADTHALALIVEHLRRPQHFIELADRAARLGKPIVALKLGRSAAAARVARTHTSAIVGNEAAYTALFERYGIARAHSPEALILLAATLSCAPRPTGTQAVIVASSGGVGELLADLAADIQLALTPLTQQPPAPLQILFGERLDNPVDFGRALPHLPPKAPSVMRQLAEGLTRHPNADIILFGLSAMPQLAENVRQLLAGLNHTPLVVYDAAPAPGAGADEAKAELRAHNVWPMPDARLAAQTAKALVDHAAFVRTYNPPQKIKPVAIQSASGVLTDPASRAVLASAGLPLAPATLARDIDEAVVLAQACGFPVALKIISPGIIHKNAVGAVQLHLATPEAVRVAYAEMLARVHAHQPEAILEGMLVQPMITGLEVLLGSHTDSHLGPIVVFGPGGVWTEAARDVVYAWPPLTVAEAEQLIRCWRGQAILQSQPSDINTLAYFIAAFSETIVALGKAVRAIDLNPVIVRPPGEGVFVADARVEVA